MCVFGCVGGSHEWCIGSRIASGGEEQEVVIIWMSMLMVLMTFFFGLNNLTIFHQRIATFCYISFVHDRM